MVFFFVFSACDFRERLEKHKRTVDEGFCHSPAYHIGQHAVRHNICIPNAQYSSFSALRNLWYEILEF